MPVVIDNRPTAAVVRKLYAELVARRPVARKAHDYYDGVHNLAFSSEKFLDTFGGLFRAFADNWCGVVTDAAEERLQINGFRVNSEVTADDGAKRLWEENELDAQASAGMLDGLISGAFAVVIWPGEEDESSPDIAVESCLTTIVEHHPKYRRRRTAALRVWLADDGYEHAELFRATGNPATSGVYFLKSKSKRAGGIAGGERSLWVIEDQLDLATTLDVDGRMAFPTGLSVVPVVEFVNKPRLTLSRAGWGAHSELASVIPVQDAVNKLVADMLVAAEHGAIPQRTLTGYEPDEEIDADGKPTGKIIPPNFRPGAGNLWWTDSENAKFGQFDPTSLKNYVDGVGMLVQHIASITATPAHYLSASADRLSGESIKSAESGLVAKVRRKMRPWGAGWEEVMRIAGTIAGNAELANATQMETIWRDPETRTEAEHVDALGKKAQLLNVPAPQLWEEAGYSPEQIGRFAAMRAQMQLEGMAANAAETARLATEQADRLRQASLEATGGNPPALPPATV